MTLIVVLVVTATVLALGLWVRTRLAAARRQLVELEAFRSELAIPAERFQVVDVSLGESFRRALRPSGRLPRFEDVHRVRFATDAHARAYADDVRGEAG